MKTRTKDESKVPNLPTFDNLGAKSAESTGLFSMPVNRAVSLPDASRASDRKDSTPQ
jgi:hypothetical protein